MSLKRSSFDCDDDTNTPKRLRGGGIVEDNDDDINIVADDFVDDLDIEDAILMDDPPEEDDDHDAHDTADAILLPEQLSETLKSKWTRPKLTITTNDEDLSFQWLDIDVISGKPLTQNPNPNARHVIGATATSASGTTTMTPQVPILRVYGVTMQGHSVAAFLHGFTPYAYFALPPSSAQWDTSDATLRQVRFLLNSKLQMASRGTHHSSGGGGSSSSSSGAATAPPDLVLSVAMVNNYTSLVGYNSKYDKFLKIHVALPQLVPTLKRVLEQEGISWPSSSSSSVSSSSPPTQLAAFECNVPFVLRFMIDCDISGAGWLTLPQNTYQIRRNSPQTHCQLEVDVTYNDVIAHKSEGEWNKIAPLRILSFDIECQGRKGYFPEAEHDPVIQIANALTEYGSRSTAASDDDTGHANDSDRQVVLQNVFTLKGCLPIVGSQVITSDTEEEMLMKWRAFLIQSDPDILTGYNVQNFDIPYLLDRAETLGKRQQQNQRKTSSSTTSSSSSSKLMQGFRQWGRIRTGLAKMRETMFQSAAYGRRANVETTIEGRVVFDMLPYMQRNHKLSSYTLNSVCAEFLGGQQKEDVHHSIIADLQNGTDEDRHRLAVYCLKDALLPLRLMEKLSVLVNYIEMARVTGVPVSFLIARGQQIKVFSMILRKCRKEKMLVPTLQKTGQSGADQGYEGATVLDPIKAYYEVPIATLDFASLYPSIMQAYNLCYSTLINPADVSKVDPKLYKKSENGNAFVHATVKKGILPTILEELLAARKRAKKDMKLAPTEFERAVQNGRQLALKVSANSVYGFTGATVGQLPCVPIASSVTSYGRQLLEKTKAFVEEEFTIAKGYQHNAQVVYGDTDSVMIKFGPDNVKDTFPLAIKAAEECTKIFPKPIDLEFEKVYFPYLLMNKKRYAGLMWTQVDKYDKMDTKGLETVRRDNCALVREVIQTSLDKIIIGKDVPGAIEYVKSQIADLLQNKMDISRLVITKSLNKGAEYALGLGGKKDDYKTKQAHVELAARMKKRDPGSAPQMGDRVPYVIITGAKGAANFEKAEDPIYVLENNLPIDCKWYLSNQLSKPLTRIFEPIIDNVEKSLLQGDHTRKIFIPTPTARKGSLTMFAVKKATCLGCKVAIDPKTHGYLCNHCAPREAELYIEKLNALREAEVRYATLWSAAQRIHGTVHSDIMCTGDGCACQFYRRKKVQADIRLAEDVVNKFGR